jgi:flagellar biosynthesis/type III secretory pathway protein FliH
VEQRRRVEQQQASLLQQQRRTQQYRYQQDYWNHQRQLQEQAWRDRDRYVYVYPNYRYRRAGSYYYVNQYGVNLIQEALNDGYQQGFYAGRADRMDSWRYDYDNSYAYQDASYGYYGFYISQSEYSYYFREGFRRGYEDGYYSRDQYGRYYGGRYGLLDSVLSVIFSAVRYR